MGADAATVPLEELERLWDFDDPAGTERRFLALLPRAQQEREGRFLGELLTQLAGARGLQRRFEDADSTLDETAAAVRADDERGRVRLLLERGRVANTAGREGRGAAEFADAWERARAAGEDGLAVDAAHMLGIVEPPERPGVERARDGARADVARPARPRLGGSLANNMGWARHEAGDHSEALALFEVALVERRRDGTASQVRIARWCVGRCLRALGRVEEALAEQRTLAAELDAIGGVDGYVDEELGECLLALGRGDEAGAHFSRAHTRLSCDAELRANAPERLERLRSLGAASRRAEPQTEP